MASLQKAVPSTRAVLALTVLDGVKAMMPDRALGRMARWRTVRCPLPDGRPIRIRPFTTDLAIVKEIWGRRAYGPNEYLPFTDGEPLIDIGAHIGIFARLYARYCPSSKLVCIEPASENLGLLRQNLAYGMAASYEVLPYAAAGTGGFRRLFIREDDQGAHSLSPVGSGGEGARMVPTLTLDEILSRYLPTRHAFLKLDCEGSEYEILISASSRTLARISKLALEYHVFSEAQVLERRRMVKRLRGEGFGLRAYPTSPTNGILLAKRN